MNEARERALILAQEGEIKNGTPTAESVLERAKKYLAFLYGTEGDENPRGKDDES